MPVLEPISPVKSPEAIGLPEKFSKWRPNQESAVNSLLNSPKRSSVLCAPTGCHAPGQRVLLFTGLPCLVEDVRVGDLLMGPDGEPREVLNLIEGMGPVFTTVPVKGESFSVNSDHILSLVRTNDGWGKANKIVEIPVANYLGKSKTYKHIHKLYRVPIEFQINFEGLPIEPYFLGILLGDGTLGRYGVGVTTIDQEILEEVQRQAEIFDLGVRKDGLTFYLTRGKKTGLPVKGELQNHLRDLGLHAKHGRDKSIPQRYRLGSKNTRFQILAGLLDTDGHYHDGCFNYISQSCSLASDVTFVARSLGLAAYCTQVTKGCQTGAFGEYYRVSISGDVAFIPCRLKRKMGQLREQKKNVLRTGFKIVNPRWGEFFGFTLSGDGRYLLSDFTVTHNSGKTAMYMGVALASKKRTGILTATRALADQLLLDYESCGLVDIRGKDNYQCALREDYTCNDGRVARCPYVGSVACPYSLAEMKVKTSHIFVSNYSKWMYTSKLDTPLANVEQLICDEGHLALEELSQAMQVVLHHREIEEGLGVPFLDGTEADEFWNWKRWARETLDKCTEQLRIATNKLECADPKPAWVKQYSHLKNLQQRLNTLTQANPQDWVAEEIPNVGFQFDPIRPARYAEIKLFCRIPRIIMVSATIRPKTMFMLGVSQDRFDFLEYPSDFDPSRCPTYHIPTLRNDHKCTDFSMLYLRGDQIMARRGDRKGIIHTVSWARLEEVLACSKYSSRMLVNTKGESATAAIQGFKDAPPPAVLVSPSVSTGIDFPYKDAEYQIILKIPFQDGRSKIIQARQADDKDYGAYRAMQSLVQTVGRTMRAKDDRSESFLIDDHISWFLPKYSHFAPKSFHKFFRTVNTVPPPPPLL